MGLDSTWEGLLSSGTPGVFRVHLQKTPVLLKRARRPAPSSMSVGDGRRGEAARAG